MPEQSPQRQRLRSLMEARCEELGLTWTEVAAKGGSSVKTLHSVRTEDHRIQPATQRAIETGLQWAPGSLREIEAGGDPADAPAERRIPVSPASASQVAEAAFGSGIVSRARPYANEIFLRLRDLAAEGITEPDGRQMFGGDSRDARSWDLHAEEMPVAELVWLIAALRARDAGASRGRGLSPDPGRMLPGRNDTPAVAGIRRKRLRARTASRKPAFLR